MEKKREYSEEYGILMFGKKFIPDNVKDIVEFSLISGHKNNEWIIKKDAKFLSTEGMGYFSTKAKNLDTLLDILINHRLFLKKIGVKELIIDVKIEYKKQCNWSLSIDEIKKLKRANVILNVSVYKV